MDLAVFILVLIGIAFWLLGRGSQTRKSDRPSKSYQRTVEPRSAPQWALQFDKKPTLLSGRAYVLDGDSLRIRNTEIRLFGIDAPELNHPYGQNAKWALIALCKGQIIRAEIDHIDHFDRTVARCRLNDGRDLSAEMVKLGLAIDWPKFSGGEYRALEVPNARTKMWLADARQKGRMHVWEAYEAQKQVRNKSV